MKQQWRQLANRFDALSRRERAIVALAVLVVGGWLAYLWLVEPALDRRAGAIKRIAQTSGEMTAIETQLAVLQIQAKDPDAANRAALQELRTRTGALDAKLNSLQGSMVPAERMPMFLESLLAKHRNLDLLALRTLPPSPLIERAEDKKADAKAAPSSDGPANVYKHGVEIRIAGSYNDLLTYLTELESMPQRVIWNRVTLSVDEYPRSVVTLIVYTLSLDKQWLVL